MNFDVLQEIWLNQRWSKSVDWTRPRQMEGPTDHQYDAVAVGAGRRTIGQLAGHEDMT